MSGRASDVAKLLLHSGPGHGPNTTSDISWTLINNISAYPQHKAQAKRFSRAHSGGRTRWSTLRTGRMGHGADLRAASRRGAAAAGHRSSVPALLTREGGSDVVGAADGACPTSGRLWGERTARTNAAWHAGTRRAQARGVQLRGGAPMENQMSVRDTVGSSDCKSLIKRWDSGGDVGGGGLFQGVLRVAVTKFRRKRIESKFDAPRTRATKLPKMQE